MLFLIWRSFTVIVFAIAAILTNLPYDFSRAFAQGSKDGSLEVIAPFVRAMPGGAKVGAGYLKIRNSSDQPDRLLAVESPDAKSVQIHIMTHEGGIMKMRQLSEGLLLLPKSTTELGPGGLHLMFLEPLAPFKLGGAIKVTLAFEKAGQLEVTFGVKPIGAR